MVLAGMVVGKHLRKRTHGRMRRWKHGIKTIFREVDGKNEFKVTSSGVLSYRCSATAFCYHREMPTAIHLYRISSSNEGGQS
jgi:hypothetical protein